MLNYHIRIIILSIIILFSYNVSHSQSLDFGLKTGLNTSYFHGDRYSFIEDDVRLILDPTIAVRFTGGGIARLNITPVFSLQTEVLYSTKGARFDEDIEVRGQTLGLDGNITLGYIETPLLFRFSTTLPDRGPLFYPKPGMTYNIYTGGVAAYRTRATFSGELTGDLFGVPFDEEFKNRVWRQFSDIDYGVVIGGGFEYGADDETKYFIDVRYMLGFMDIGEDRETNFSLRNANIAITMGIMF